MMGWARREDEVTVRGPAVGAPAGFAPIEGGPEGFGVEGLEVAGEGLSQESKKSSVEALGVFEASGVSSSPSMWMPWGFLQRQLGVEGQVGMISRDQIPSAHFCASAWIRRASSSLYSPACLEVYLALASVFCGGRSD